MSSLVQISSISFLMYHGNDNKFWNQKKKRNGSENKTKNLASNSTHTHTYIESIQDTNTHMYRQKDRDIHPRKSRKKSENIYLLFHFTLCFFSQFPNFFSIYLTYYRPIVVRKLWQTRFIVLVHFVHVILLIFFLFHVFECVCIRSIFVFYSSLFIFPPPFSFVVNYRIIIIIIIVPHLNVISCK